LRHRVWRAERYADHGLRKDCEYAHHKRKFGAGRTQPRPQILKHGKRKSLNFVKAAFSFFHIFSSTDQHSGLDALLHSISCTEANKLELEKEVADVQFRMRDEKLKLNAQFATLKTMKEAMKAEFWQRFGGATEFMMARQHFEEDQNAREDKC
jgi:hypothetical protein